MVTAERAKAAVATWRRDPLHFCRTVLSAKLYDKQRDILRAAATSRRVSCCGANATGKDFLTGQVLIPWWLCTRYPSKVIILAPTYRQVEAIIWKEVRLSYQTARVPLGGQMYPKSPRWEFDDQHFALGFATNEPYSIQGFHSPHLLCVISEAHAMAQSHIDAVKRLNPELLVMTGNPFTASGEFYDSHHGQRALWSAIGISAFDTPNVQERRVVVPGLVTWEDVQERLREWGEDNHLYQAAVLGQFPDSLDDALVPLTAAMVAVNHGLAPGKPNVVAMDVARFGSDKSVICHRRGPWARIVWKGQGRDLMESAGRLKRYVDEWNERERYNIEKANLHRKEGEPAVLAEAIDAVVVDDTGLGGGVSDRLRELGMRVVRFNGGEKARWADKYQNSVTEAWMLMADAFRKGEIDIERDDALIGQLTARRYTIQSDRRVKIESKEDMRPKDGLSRATWRSPDEADALAMTFTPFAARGRFPIIVSDARAEEQFDA